MGAVADAAAPTIDDARTAGRALTAAGYAADEMARRHGRRPLNDSIDRLTGGLRRFAASIDISTGEPCRPDPEPT